MALNLNCLIVGNHPFSTPAVRVPHGESEISFIFRQWMFQRAVKGSKTIARPDGFREFSQATGRAELPTDVKGTDFITETLRQHPTFLFPEGGANFLRQDEDYKKYKIGTSFIYTCSNVGQNYVILMAISDTPNHTQKIELFGLLDVSERVGEDKKAGINRITQEFADRIVSCKIGSSF